MNKREIRIPTDQIDSAESIAYTITDFQEKYIAQFNRYIRESKDTILAIMAPTTKDYGFRVYANGGCLAEIKKSKTVFLNKEYDKKFSDGIFTTQQIAAYRNKFSYFQDWDDVSYNEFKEFVDQCIRVTEKWSADDKQTHFERKTENEMIAFFRRNKRVTFIDMEFFAEKSTYGGVSEYGEYSRKGFDLRGGRVDLVVYDPNSGFGLIELKYNNESMSNVGKHFADFDAMVNGKKNHKDAIVGELERRLEILMDQGIVDKTPIKSRELWYGFLLIGNETDSNEKVYMDTIRETANWKWMETRGKKGAKISCCLNYTDLMEAYKNKTVKNPGRYVWSSDYKDPAFHLNYKKMKELKF